MSRKEKLIKKFLENPGSVGYFEIEGLLFDFGFGLESKRGSHGKFRHFGSGIIVVVSVHGRDCKKRYKTHIAEILKNYFL